jgi:subtilisin family serine protease
VIVIKKVCLLACIIFCLFSNSVYANSNGYLVKVKNKPTTKLSLLRANEAELSEGSNLYLAKDEDELNRMLKSYDVEYFEPDYKMELFDAPSDPLYSEQWNLDMIKATAAWNIGCYGNEVKIAVIDSGIFPHHDINNNILPGFNYLYTSENEKSNVYDNVGHGSFVSGLIASEWNNLGIVGVANMAKIVPLKCFNTTTIDASIVIPAIYDAVNHYGCKIINISFGSSMDSASLKAAIDYAVSKGAIIVSAVGNSSGTTLFYPASYDNVIGVSSVDRSKVRAYFAQYNKSVFVTAPGVDVKSLDYNNSYKTWSGTSFSTPQVTAMVALARRIKEDITLDEVKQLFMTTSDDLGITGKDTSYGYGLVNVEKFINELLKNTDVYVSPIDNRNNIAKVKILNNTNLPTTMTSIFGDYSNDKLNNISLRNLDFFPKQVQTVTYETTYINLKYFLWRDFATMLPMAKVK